MSDAAQRIIDLVIAGAHIPGADANVERVVKSEITAIITAAQRNALLEGQSRWLEDAEKAETLIQKTIGAVIAAAFEHEAELYKTVQDELQTDVSSEPELPSIDE